MSASAKLFLAFKKKGGGEIPGESNVEGYRGQIEIDDWTWNVSRGKNSDKTGAADKAEPSVLSFSKTMDRSSTAMMNALRVGDEHEALFTLVDQTQGEFKLTLKLDNVRVTKYKMDIKLEKDMGTIEESWDFNYTGIEFKYFPRAEKGKPAGAISASLTRSPNASTESAKGPEAKLIDLAGQMSPDELEALLPRLKTAAKEFEERKKNPPKDNKAQGSGARPGAR